LYNVRYIASFAAYILYLRLTNETNLIDAKNPNAYYKSTVINQHLDL